MSKQKTKQMIKVVSVMNGKIAFESECNKYFSVKIILPMFHSTEVNDVNLTRENGTY